MGIRAKLLFALAVLFLNIVAIIGYAIYNAFDTKERVHQMMGVTYHKIDVVHDARTITHVINKTVYETAFVPDVTAKQLKRNTMKLNSLKDALPVMFDDIKSGKFALVDTEKTVVAADQARLAYTSQLESLLTLIRANDLEQAKSLYMAAVFNESRESMFQSMDMLVGSLKQELEQQTTQVDTAFDHSLIAFAILALIPLIIFALLLWKSETGIVRPIQQMSALLTRIASTGDFSARLSPASRDEVGKMAHSVNALMEGLESALLEANRVVGAIAHADFDQRISNHYMGTLNTLKEGVNASAESVSFMMAQLSSVMHAMSQGQLNAQMDERVPLAFREQVDFAMRSIHDIIADINSTMAHLSEGEFSSRVSVNAAGELLTMKQRVNEALETLDNMTNELLVVANAQRQGDLTVETKGVYQGRLQILQAARADSTQKIKGMITDALHASHIVHEAANQVSLGAAELSERIREQAAVLEETSTAMHQMNVTIQANAVNAQKVACLAHQVEKQSAEGVNVMQQTITAMQSISESSHKIGDIVTLIDSISFQTNLLALNAAVEAARAGEHGRGFAVVASEVRALAGKSADAAKDIKRLIEDSISRIQNGTELADRSGETLNGITQAIEQVAGMIEEIATASNEQSSGVEQIHKAIAGIDRVTQENAALVEETAVAADSLKTEADQLSRNMSFFRTGNVRHPKRLT